MHFVFICSKISAFGKTERIFSAGKHMYDNVQQNMDELTESLKRSGRRPALLLHCCCAPCASYVLEYLCGSFDVSVYFYNPNIYPQAEYQKRRAELLRLISLMPCDVGFLECAYDEAEFTAAANGLENCPEGGERCRVCFALRLGETAKAAKLNGFDMFATTLTVSPHKNAEAVNAAGEAAAKLYGAEYLPSNFKKRNGYLRSLQLSRQYDLYRQNYCGCRYSLPAQIEPERNNLL